MQLSTLQAKVPQAITFKWGTTETEQAHYFQIWDLYSTVMEHLTLGTIRVLDDRLYLSSMIA